MGTSVCSDSLRPPANMPLGREGGGRHEDAVGVGSERRPVPEIVAGGGQQDPVRPQGSTLHQQHHIVEGAGLPEVQQTVEEAAEMGRAPEVLAALPPPGTRVRLVSHGGPLGAGSFLPAALLLTLAASRASTRGQAAADVGRGGKWGSSLCR